MVENIQLANLAITFFQAAKKTWSKAVRWVMPCMGKLMLHVV